MSHVRFKYSLLLLCFLLTACESSVNPDILPDFQPKMVVAAFISPTDNVMNFFVSTNRNLYGELNREEQTGRLTAFITDGQTETELDTASHGFVLSREKLELINGKSYLLKIKSENGLYAEGTCTIPQDRDFSIKADTFSILSRDPWGTYTRRPIYMKVSFSDFAGEKNYYRLSGKVINYSTNQGTVRQSKFPLQFENYLLNDKGVEGKSITINTQSILNQSYLSDSAKITIYLYNTEESYYLYHRSYEQYNHDDNPFAEATPMYSNIKGGLGVFTSYTIDSLIIKIRKQN